MLTQRTSHVNLSNVTIACLHLNVKKTMLFTKSACKVSSEPDVYNAGESDMQCQILVI